MPDERQSEPWFDEQTFTLLRGTVSAQIFQRLLRLFLENTSNRLEEIMSLDPQAEPERLAVALHALKGSALMVGARELESMVEDLRAATRRRDAEAMKQGILHLKGALRRVHDRVGQELEA
jgi:HPt (histidine-containing phosphotransfer) domain-containing protein